MRYQHMSIAVSEHIVYIELYLSSPQQNCRLIYFSLFTLIPSKHYGLLYTIFQIWLKRYVPNSSLAERTIGNQNNHILNFNLISLVPCHGPPSRWTQLPYILSIIVRRWNPIPKWVTIIRSNTMSPPNNCWFGTNLIMKFLDFFFFLSHRINQTSKE